MMIVLVLCAIVVLFFSGVAIFGDYKATEVQDNERSDTRNVSFVRYWIVFQFLVEPLF